MPRPPLFAQDLGDLLFVEHHMSPGALIMQTLEPVAVVAQPDPPTGVTAVSAPRRGSQYAVLLRQVKQAGLLDRRTQYYVRRIAITTALLAGGWLAFVLVGDSWWQLAVAAFLAVVFAQVGFLAHDAGHKQVFTSRRANDFAGILLGNLAVGLGYSYWLDNHNRHHAHPNTDALDPDVNFGALAFTPDQAGSRGRFARLAYRYQAYFFFPLLTLTALGLHIDSAAYLARRTGRSQTWERLLFAAHVLGYLAVVFWVLPPVKAAVFILVHQGLVGLYLGASFAPNHKGMPMLAADDNTDFLRRQVLTSRNIRGGWLVDIALGALNYQIEHHLFPNMPRPNLRRAQLIIAEFCRQHSLPYVQTSLLDSYAQTLRHLDAVGRHPQPGTP
jgi:fatty acid desaturase